ncbi:hypothetical protein [Georgenia sp. AZ-5]|uniref:hypothetical protein n=1 Tax=Georgenia sp. AZ-5 TaxID=3367526 RepID=UPI003754EF51
MLVRSPTARLWHRVRLALGIVLGCLLVGFTAYGVVSTVTRNPRAADPVITSSGPRAVAPQAPPDLAADGERAPIDATPDPAAFATDVSRAIFDWDTTGPVDLAEIKGRLLAVADPTGHEAPGLVADLAGYVPSAPTWDFLTQYSTRQWIEIRDVAEPAQWARALAAAGEDAPAPGVTALTVTGVRHRAGVWQGEPVRQQFDVAFTVFVVCEPSYPTCYLLRLSQLDNPLR